MEWQSIETAPRDGTRILVFSPLGIQIAFWNTRPMIWENEETEQAWTVFPCEEDYFYSVHLIGDNSPTHWMPLPEPPQ